jgi:23S rRNA (guanosine2251-2'-O)-methyltransferase
MAGMDWVAGKIPVLECLRAKKRKAHGLFILREGKGGETIRSEAAANGVPIHECSRADLNRLLPAGVHQGVALHVDPLPVLKAECWAQSPFSPEAIVVALDGVEDPHNFGAIVRSAAACGACAVVFGKDRAAPISHVSVKSAAGAMEYMDLVQATNLVRTLDALKEAGFWIAGLDAQAPQNLWDADLTGRVVLVIGSEGKGIRRLVREHCDLHLRIPLTGPITSLNASTSAAAALAECLRQRTAAR